MSNEEFDNLAEELLWQGSKVPVLRCDTHAAAQLVALQCHGRTWFDAAITFLYQSHFLYEQQRGPA